MNDLQYKLSLICSRREVSITKVESVAVSMRCNFGLANNTALIPAGANFFYYGTLQVAVVVQNVTAGPILRFTSYGGGSGGNVDYVCLLSIQSVAELFGPLEFDSLTYVVNGNTAGAISIWGDVLKVTY